MPVNKFKPQEDITVKEVAEILEMIQLAIDDERLFKLSVESQRHFRRD